MINNNKYNKLLEDTSSHIHDEYIEICHENSNLLFFTFGIISGGLFGLHLSVAFFMFGILQLTETYFVDRKKTQFIILVNYWMLVVGIIFELVPNSIIGACEIGVTLSTIISRRTLEPKSAAFLAISTNQIYTLSSLNSLIILANAILMYFI